MGHHHHHHHSHSGDREPHHHTPSNYNRAFLVGLILNLGFVLAEFGFGVVANSVALIADAGHNLSDVLGLLLAWSASLVARRKPSSRYTYGWRKASILAAFLNAIFLLVATGAIAWEAVDRFIHPTPVRGAIVMGVAVLGIAINSITALMFASGRKADMNIRAAFQHMAADALVSLGVVLAGITILYTGWLWLDPAFSLIISALIIFGTWELLKDSFNLAIDGVPDRIDERAVRTYLLERPGVNGIHDLHIWSLSTVETALTAHLVMYEGHPGDEFLAEICLDLQQHFGIQHTTLQIEIGNGDRSCLLESSCQF